VQRSYTATFLAAESDGTQRPDKSSSTPVAEGRTTLLANAGVRGQVGLLEIDASPIMSIAARLISTSPSGQITYSTVPVISSDNLFAADGTAIVEGLGRDAESGDVSSLGIVNLAQQGATCEVEVFRADGSQVGGTFSLAFKPLSLRYFNDAFGLLGEQSLADARFEVTCNQPFYAYATTFRQGTSQLLFTEPSATGASTLTAPGSEDPQQPPPTAGAIVYAIPGLFHTATTQKPKEQRHITLDRDLSLKRLVLDMDFVPSAWNLTKIPGNHAIFWLYRGKFRSNTIGNVNAFGPNKLTLKAAQNIDLPAHASTQKDGNVAWELGRKYHLHYTYDAEHGTVTAELSLGGSVVRTLQFDSTATNRVLTVPANGLIVEFGHYANQEGPEVASFGWQYSNLRIEMVPY
jgi:hypothetical protein